MLELFTAGFFLRALAGGALIALTAAPVGVFLVLRRQAMIGDGIAHVSIAGVALGFLINLYPIGVGIAFAVAASLAIEALRRAYRTYAELSIAVIMAGGIALASLFFTMGMGFSVNVTSYLFGSIYTLDDTDLAVISAIAAAVLAFAVIFQKELFLLAFDEDAAAVNGLPVRIFNVLASVLTALVISAAIKIVGALLVSALITIPAACALALARSFRQALGLAVAAGEIAVILGLLTAGWWNLAPGGTVVLLLIAMLVVALAARRLSI